MDKTISKMIEAWVSRKGTCEVSSYNFIEQEDEFNWKVSVMEKDRYGETWVCMYRIWVSDTEFRIVEIK